MSEVAKFKQGLWGSSMGTAEDGKAFFKRLRSDIEAPIANMPYESFVTIKFQFPENGMPGDKETVDLDNIENILLKELEDSELGRLVYVQTYDGHRVFLFYTQEDLSKKHRNMFKGIPNKYKLSILSERDPEWKFLFQVRNSYFQKLSSEN